MGQVLLEDSAEEVVEFISFQADEREWMPQHGRYLDQLLDQGLLVAHGPVMDPGGYGVSLFRIADAQDIAALTSADPIIRNGVGHYEHHPKLHLKSRA
ncbi:MAG: YciI family protein [Burkholderiaceae bacterium]